VQTFQLRTDACHAFTVGNKSYLYHSIRGDVYEVDELTATLYRQLQTKDQVLAGDQHNLEEINEAEKNERLNELREFDIYLQQNSEQSLPLKKLKIDALALEITFACNFSCRYCFAANARDKRSRQQSAMTKETAFKAVDYLFENCEKDECFITFGGGEPLLATKVLEETVKYARNCEMQTGKKCFISISTNGAFLSKEFIKFALDNYLDICVSLDGPPNVQDNLRPLSNGQGSWAKIEEPIRNYLEAYQKRSKCRLTITQQNKDFIQLSEYLVNLGFGYIFPHYVQTKKSDLVLSEKDIHDLCSQYTEVAEGLITDFEKYKPFLAYFSNHIKLIDGRQKVIFGCRAGKNYFAVSPDGNIYPCHRFIGYDDFVLGNLNTSTNNLYNNFFMNAHVDVRECITCWCRYLCGGACLYDAYLYSGSNLNPDPKLCRLYRHRIELAIYLYINLRKTLKNLKEELFRVMEGA